MREYVYFIHPTRPEMINAPTERESKLVGEHFQYLKGLLDAGDLILAGPSIEPPYTGIIVFRAMDADAAKRVVEGDPGVAGGVFDARVSEFRCSLLGSRKNDQPTSITPESDRIVEG